MSLKDKERPTGMALIELTSKGENRIIVSPGANSSLGEKDLKLLDSSLEWDERLCDPIGDPYRNCQDGFRNGQASWYHHPSQSIPAVQLSSDILSLVDFLVPNEREGQFLGRLKLKGDRDISKIGKKLLEMGTRNVW